MSEPASRGTLSSAGTRRPTSPVVRAPGHDEELPDIDDRIVMPEGRFEAIEGQLVECAPAKEPHALAHTQLGFVLRAHARATFSVATDMLTRVNRFSDMAPDVSVFPTARDPVTGSRQLEHLSFEICDSQERSDVARKARLLTARGVRRVFCVDVHQGAVLAWNSTHDRWDELPLSGQITDRTCFVRAVPVRALLEEMQAENAAAHAMLSKKNEVLQDALHEREKLGQQSGLAQGLEQGLEQGLRRAIESACALCEIAWTAERQATIGKAGRQELEQRLAEISKHRSWPD